MGKITYPSVLRNKLTKTDNILRCKQYVLSAFLMLSIAFISYGQGPDTDSLSTYCESVYRSDPNSGATEVLDSAGQPILGVFAGVNVVVTGDDSPGSGGVDAFIREPTAISNSQYQLLYSSTDLQSFLSSGIMPTSVDNGDGATTLTWSNLHTVLSAKGFVILNVTDGVDDCCSEPYGWSALSLDGTSGVAQDVANNFLFNSDYEGVIVSNTGTTITTNGDADLSALQLAGFEYYIEVLDGTAEGARFKMLEASATATNMIIDRR